MKKITAPLLLLCLAGSAAAAGFEALNISAVQVPAAPAAAPAPAAGNFYLDIKSYDPLLMNGAGQLRRPSAQKGLLSPKFEFPGIDATLDFARAYRQAAYKRHDLQNDVSLAVYTYNIPKVLFNVLFGVIQDNGNPDGGAYNNVNQVVTENTPPPQPTEEQIKALDIPADEKERLLVQLRNSKLQIDGRVNPFKVKEMLLMYTQIIKEERANGIEPSFGLPHEWSPEFVDYSKKKVIALPLGFSKLLTALASGVTARYFKTGAEEQLISYILARPEGSITLHELFRVSYRLNAGDVYLAILTQLNVLSDNWRHPQRDQLAVTRKLSLITNFYQGRGDKYGAWYHLQGIMLYGYVKGGFRAWLVGGIETAGSHVLGSASDQGTEQQEDYVNATGGKIGARLAKVLEKKKYLSFNETKNYCDASVYLKLGEDFRDRIEFVESGEFEARLDENRMWLKAKSRDYLDCHVEIIYNDYSGELNSQNIVKEDHVDFKKGKSVPVFVTWDDLQKARAFISGCKAAPGAPAQKGFGKAAPRGFRVDAGR